MRTFTLFITGLLITGSVAVNAQSNPIPQTEKGQILVGGSIRALWRNTSNEDKRGGSLYYKSERKRRSISLAPEASYFIDTNLAIGIEGTYRYRISISPKQPSVGDTSKIEDTRQTVSLGPTLRYYKSISDKLAFFGQASAYYEFGSTRNEVNGTKKGESDIMGFGGSVRPGITWFISDNLGINFSIPRFVVYSYTEEEGTRDRQVNDPNGPGTITRKIDESRTSSDLNLNLGLSRISVGVNVFL
jgi:outer membrane protein